MLEEVLKNIPGGLLYVLIGLIVWRAAAFYFGRFCPFENKVKDIDNNIKGINNNITTIRGNISKIISFLITGDKKAKAFFVAHSPIELNDLGKEILDKSGARNFIDSSLESLISKIKDGNPKSYLDIHQLAVSVLFNLLDTEPFSGIKDFVYQNPQYKGNDIDIQAIINLAALYLRDKYIEQGILPEEIIPGTPEIPGTPH